MKIIIVGGSGTIGAHLAQSLKADKHEVIIVGSKSGDYQVDFTKSEQIPGLFEKIGAFDALVVAAGGGYWGDFYSMTEADVYKGIQSKLMGQVNLVLEGKKHINPGGVFVLTSGVLSTEPTFGSNNLTMVNAAVNAFVVSAAIELKNDVRINVVSPGLLEDSIHSFGPVMPGFEPVPAAKVVYGYKKAIFTGISGKIIEVSA
ncbi:NAD(P)-dependent dehydrogenase (short-subunit alcohol dehydrogenase family) [Chitinophaga skermanii]|uniref:NAD(P)-dependent dehydrogenase (Short-subunit alcohol dehydrogenase family) n=1 Tax=Chitinophaga skermanii TaxID=331697 RepID=A0A327Q986_9BACT|nr:short chain dehydrogenase [Chitinophaga skermanii]RAJ00252.1 NAD(P)-dependent dehydrogenase (short-subunit alcohol dehydrogenase family) [Chitinophaga skermanii]